MKKSLYEVPDFEMIKFYEEDVITTSTLNAFPEGDGEVIDGSDFTWW